MGWLALGLPLKQRPPDPYAILEFVELVQGSPPWAAYFLLELARIGSEVQSKILCETVKYKGTGYSAILRKLASRGWVEQLGHGKWRISPEGQHLVDSMNLLGQSLDHQQEQVVESPPMKTQDIKALEKIILSLYEQNAYEPESAVSLSSSELNQIKEKLVEGFLMGKTKQNCVFLKAPGGILMARKLRLNRKNLE